MNRTLINALALSVFCSAAAAQQPLVMVHGLASSPETWSTLKPLMENDGWAIHTPTLDGFGSFIENKITLNDYFYQHGLGSNTVLLGHSMGGLISRSSSRDNSVEGVVTIGTPHEGANAAWALQMDWSSPILRTATDLVWLHEVLNSIPNNAFEWENEYISGWDIDDIRDMGYNAWENMAYLIGPGISGVLIQQFFHGNALDDLAPNSNAMQLLAQSAWQENGNPYRKAFYAMMSDGYIGHEFTLIPGMDPVQADYYGNQMINDGYWTYLAGMQMEMAGGDSGNWSMAAAGGAIMNLGDMEFFYWKWWAWNVIQGHPGFFNDGIVSSQSQQRWPDVNGGMVPAEFLGYSFHTAETSGLAPALRAHLNITFDH